MNAITHKVVAKENGKFGVMRIASGCVYGNFDSYVEAFAAICQAANADQSIGIGQ